MSWLAPVPADRRMADYVRSDEPEVYALALRLAPALRIEPRLLRNARLRFFPNSDAGLEARLWHGKLVGTRSVRAITLTPGVARVLTDELLAQRPRFVKSWELVCANTAHWPILERLEQELRLAAIDPQAKPQDRLDKLEQALAELVYESDEEKRLDGARWAKYALPDIVETDHDIPEAAWLAQYAAAALGDPGGPLSQRSGATPSLPDWLSALLPSSGAGSTIGLRWHPGVLGCLQPGEGEHDVPLPTPLPTLLFLSVDNHGGQWELFWPGRRIRLPVTARLLTIDTLTGSRYSLSVEPAEDSEEPGLSSGPATLRGTKVFVTDVLKTRGDLRLLDAVCQGLEQAGFQILVDKGDIDAGNEWDTQLNEWMMECHAAVMLLSTAEYSEWANKEAAILSWRAELQENFKLIPVLLGDLTPEDLEKSPFPPLRVNKSQLISSHQEGPAIVAQVKERLGPSSQRAKTPFAFLEARLHKIFHNALPDALAEIWHTLESENTPPWRPDGPERFSAALARLLIRDGKHALRHVITVMERIRPAIRRDAALQLVHDVSCLWVPLESAAALLRIMRQGLSPALNGNYVERFTAARYIERAFPLGEQWRLLSIPGEGSTALDIAGIINEIRVMFRSNVKISDDNLDRQIRHDPNPIFVLLPGASSPDAHMLETLRRHYPNITYILDMGPEPSTSLPSGVEPVFPAVDLAEEEEQFSEMSDAQHFVEKLDAS